MKKIRKIEANEPAFVKRKRVVAYTRVSTGKEAMLESLSAQVSYFSSLIQKNREWDYGGVYSDEAYTGTKESRPGFQQMIADCRDGKVDMIITKSISRFARNTVTMLETIRELKELGINVFFERENINSMSSTGEFMLTILASVAQEESLSASENVKWRIRKNYKEGKSGAVMIYGYEYIKGRGLEIIPAEAEVVRQIFNDYLSGLGVNSIAKKLHTAGIPTKTKSRWSGNTIASMLRNEKYIGDALLQKNYVENHLTKKVKVNNGQLPQYYVHNDHEPIIDREIFEKVQEEIARRAEKSNRDNRRQYPFSGKIFCGICGVRYVRKISHSKSNPTPIWHCYTYDRLGKSECPSKRVPEEVLKEKVKEVLGLEEFDEEMLKKKITEIRVPANGQLEFLFFDGKSVKMQWENRPRRESWTDNMKEKARQKSLERMKKHGE